MKKKPRKLRKLEVKLVDGEYDNPLKGRAVRPRQLYDVFKDIKDLTQETVIGVYLEESHDVRAYNVLALGSASCVMFDPLLVFEQAILTRSKKFILIHNHPGGNPKPSADDLLIAQDLTRKAEVMGLALVDLIIIGDLQKPRKKNYWSLYEKQHRGARAYGDAW